MVRPIARWWWWWLPAALAAGCTADSPDDSLARDGALEGQVCGMDVLPSPQTLSGSVCDSGRTVLATRVERKAGPPNEASAQFELEQDGAVCISIRNGEVAAGWVELDGTLVAGPSDFNPHWEGLEEERSLTAGTHTVDVRVASRPGSYVDVEIREAHARLDDSPAVVGPEGILKLTNVAADHPLVTPNGDGQHDDTIFNVDGEPLVELPGHDDGSVDYFLDWHVVIVDLETCQTIDTGLSGETQINSPTNVRTLWDATDVHGDLVPSGSYAYRFEVSLVRDDGLILDTAISPAFGLIVDAAPVDDDEGLHRRGQCDPQSDPMGTNCLCPGGGTVSPHPDCYFDRPDHLVSFEDPSAADLSFITTTQGPDGRWRVVVDLRDFNAGGLVYQNLGTWDSEAELRQWVSDMTGVPVGTGKSLFNFDYTQIGPSTPVKDVGLGFSFNHFFLDAITDADGKITIGGTTIDLAAQWHIDETADQEFRVDSPREDDECAASANTDGIDAVRAKFCAYNEGFALSSSLGFYALRTSVFDVAINGVETTQDELCIINGVFACGIRTFKQRADVTIESQYFVEDGGVFLAFDDLVTASDVAGLSVGVNRELPGGNADGVCSRAVVERDGLRVRLDSADGAVSDTCIINGVFF